MKKILFTSFLLLLTAFTGCKSRGINPNSAQKFSDNAQGEKGFIAKNMQGHSWCYSYPQWILNNQGPAFGLAKINVNDDKESGNIDVTFKGAAIYATWKIENQYNLAFSGSESAGLSKVMWKNDDTKSKTFNFGSITLTPLFDIQGNGKLGTNFELNSENLANKGYCFTESNNDLKNFGIMRLFNSNNKQMVRINHFGGKLEVGTWEFNRNILTLTIDQEASGPYKVDKDGFAQTSTLPSEKILSYQYNGSGDSFRKIVEMTAEMSNSTGTATEQPLQAVMAF